MNARTPATPVIAELVSLLPKPGETFPLHNRVLWLEAAASVFAVVYDDDGDSDRIVVKAVPRETCAMPDAEIIREAYLVARAMNKETGNADWQARSLAVGDRLLQLLPEDEQ